MKTPEQIRAYCRKKGYSTEYADYWCAHSFCELWICNEQPAAPPHHIRTRGAGGGDNPSNLLALCTSHHTQAHCNGVLSFAHKYPQFHDKIYAALDIVIEPDALNIFVGRGW